jgi:hypothetical protein
MICNKLNKRNTRQRTKPFYVFLMIDGQVIFIELEGSAFNDLRSFNINAHSCDGDVLINLDVDLNAGYSGIDNIMYVVYCVDIC